MNSDFFFFLKTIEIRLNILTHKYLKKIHNL